MKIRLKIRRNIWIEIAAASTAAACVLATLVTICTAATTTAAVEPWGPAQEAQAATTEQVYEGVVTCSRCGARHSAARGKTAADCTRICAHDGASFALVDGEKTYMLEGEPGFLKTLAGERVRISGVATGDTLRVVSLVANP
jgi:hypothetical protein